MCPKIAEIGVRLWHVCSWCARWSILRCRGFAAILQLRNECTRLPNGTHVPKCGFAASKYPAEWSFSCEIGIFHVLGFRNRFAAAKWGSLCREMALVCQNVLHICEIPCGMELWSFAANSQLWNGGFCAMKWHSCAKLGFTAVKIFAEESIEMRNGFVAKC